MAPLKLWADLFRAGRLRLVKGFYKEPVTFQDSCNFIRGGGHADDARVILKHICADFREMDPGRTHTLCCGSGGGHALMPEYKKLRLATAKAKAESIRATGAETVVVACHNCEDGIRDGVKEHEVPVKVELFSNFIAPAIAI